MSGMDSKHAILLDSVKKLVGLGISDQEIVANLRQVNVSEQDARALLAEARGGKPVAREPLAARPVAEPLEEDVTESEGVFGEVAGGWEDEKEEAPEPKAKPVEAPPVREPVSMQKAFGFFGKKARVEPSPQQPVAASGQPERKPDREHLWDSGILTAVDARLDEMKRLKQELDAVLDAKIAEALKRESTKVSVLLESQRTLMLSKVQAEFESNRRQLQEILDQKLLEIRKTNELTQENVSRIQAQRQLSEQLSKDLAANIRLLEESKAKWFAETNNELQRAELRFNEFLKTAEQRLNQLEARISKTLEVEGHISEGFMNDVKLRVDDMVSGKSAELDQLLKKKMRELDQSQAVAALDAVEKKLKDLADFRESLRKDVERDFDSIYKARINQYNKQVKEKLDEVDASLAELKKAQK